MCPSMQSPFLSSKMVARVLTVDKVLLPGKDAGTIAESVFVMNGHVFEVAAAGVVSGGASKQFACVVSALVVRGKSQTLAFAIKPKSGDDPSLAKSMRSMQAPPPALVLTMYALKWLGSSAHEASPAV